MILLFLLIGVETSKQRTVHMSLCVFPLSVLTSCGSCNSHECLRGQLLEKPGIIFPFPLLTLWHWGNLRTTCFIFQSPNLLSTQTLYWLHVCSAPLLLWRFAQALSGNKTTEYICSFGGLLKGNVPQIIILIDEDNFKRAQNPLK